MKATAKRYPTMAIVLLGLLAGSVSACRAGERPASAAAQDPKPEVPVGASEQARAAALLDRAREAFEEERWEEARRRAERIASEHARTSSAGPARWIAARAAFEMGEWEAAAEHAERYAEGRAPYTAERRRADALAERARERLRDERRGRRAGPAAAAARIGVVLPLSGSPYLTRYGELVLEGLRVAETAHLERGGRPVELVVRDGLGNPDRSARLVTELEREGVVGIIGPLLDGTVRAAALARRDPSLVIVSPTAMADPGGLPNVYTVNRDDTRGADTVAEYLLRSGFRRVATLHARQDPYDRKARAFMRAMMRGGGYYVDRVPYDSGTTTFAEPMRELADSRPQAIYIPASARDVRQIAPQLAYYGLDTLGIQIVGDRAWADSVVRREIEARYLEAVIASTPLPENDRAVGWADFVAGFEGRYQRSLDNRFPALGHDAAVLLFAALAERSGFASTFDVSRRFRELEDVRGATGLMSIRAGEVTRRPFIVRIVDGQAPPAPPPEEVIPPPLWMTTEPASADSTGI
ncbi:MAG: ABC transporter substrate-binding protein [Gemmatimonadota bacterium]